MAQTYVTIFPALKFKINFHFHSESLNMQAFRARNKKRVHTRYHMTSNLHDVTP